MSMYNNSNTVTQFPKEIQSISPAESISPSESAHELMDQNGGIISRIKKMRELMQSLRLKLAVERDRLTKERMEAESTFMYQLAPTISENVVTLHSFHSLPRKPENYGVRSFGWESINFQDYQRRMQMYYYIQSRFYPPPIINELNTQSEVFKEQIQTAEKMCEEEFSKIQNSINSLLISRQYLNDRFSDSNLIYVADNYTENEKTPRKHRKHNHSRKKKHNSYQQNKRSASFYVQDDPFTLNQHRNHYCYHYKCLPERRRYINDKQNIQHFGQTDTYLPLSPDSHSSDALCYFEYTHESDDD